MRCSNSYSGDCWNGGSGSPALGGLMGLARPMKSAERHRGLLDEYLSDDRTGDSAKRRCAMAGDVPQQARIVNRTAVRACQSPDDGSRIQGLRRAFLARDSPVGTGYTVRTTHMATTMVARIRQMFTFRLLALCSLLVGLSPLQAGERDVAREMAFFYRNPRSEILIGVLDRYQGLPSRADWRAYPALAGFLAVLFRTRADEIEGWLPARLTAKSATALTAALLLSGNPSALAKLKSRLDSAGQDEKLRAEFAGLPSRLEEIRIRTATHLDILWGASFASGDARFPRMIVEFFARTVNRSEQIALDVTKTTIALMGGSSEIYSQLKPKHGDAVAFEIIIAATALWSLQSNAREHEFVDQVIAQYLHEFSATYAAKALTAIRNVPRRSPAGPSATRSRCTNTSQPPTCPT